MFVLIREVAETFLENFKEKNEIIETDMKDVFTRYSTDVIASVAFGYKVDSMKDKTNEFYRMGKKATDLTGFFTMLKILGYTVAPKLYEV